MALLALGLSLHSSDRGAGAGADGMDLSEIDLARPAGGFGLSRHGGVGVGRRAGGGGAVVRRRAVFLGCPQSIGLLAFGLAMAGLFVAIESRSKSPIMPLGIYRDRAVAVAMVVTLLTAASLHGFVLFLPLYFQVALGASVSQAGSLLAPMLLGIVVGAILAGQFLSRTGGNYRLQALVSTVLMAGGMYLFSTLDDAGRFARNSPILSSQMYLMIAALGFGGVVATLSVAVQNAVPYRDVGVATAALQFCRSPGGMTGLAITGVVMVQRFRAGVEATIPDDLEAALPTHLLGSIKDDPQALVDPTTARALQESLAETGRVDVVVTNHLLNSLNLALTDALSDVFTVLWLAVALSFAAALFLRVRAGDGHHQPPK